jgi:glycosyltransferase involved in cell wall biosynthesis
LTYFKIPEEKMLVLPNAIWLEEFPAESAQARDATPFSVFCMRSVYLPGMGLDTLSCAFLLLKELIPEITLTVVGKIASSEHAQVGSIRGVPGVQFIEFIEHAALKEIIRSASVCVVPFKNVPDLAQTYPIKVLEYLSLGKPVVASDITGIRRLIIDGETGLLYRAGDAGELADKIRRLHSDPQLRATLSRNAARHADQFDCRVKNLAILEALERLVTSHGKLQVRTGIEAA